MGSHENRNKNFWRREAFEVFAQASCWIVGPIIIAILLGQWLDERYQKEQWFLVACVTVAFIVTNIGLVRMAVKASRKMEKIIKDEKVKQKREEQL